jgi:hypothetical protein
MIHILYVYFLIQNIITWRLFQKRVVFTKLDVYVFIHQYVERIILKSDENI